MLYSFITGLYILLTEKPPLDEIPAILETKVDTQLSELQEPGKYDSEITPQRSPHQKKRFHPLHSSPTRELTLDTEEKSQSNVPSPAPSKRIRRHQLQLNT